MPGLVRKLLIVAAADGLVLQPLAQRNQRPASPVQIDYKTHTLSALSEDSRHSHEPDKLESDGIIGFLNLFTHSYLIAIAQKRQVAQLWGKPVFVITDVAFIPLQSRLEAQQAIRKASDIARSQMRNNQDDQSTSDPVEDADNDTLASLEDTWLDYEMAKDSGLHKIKPKEPGVAEGVIAHKGAYGRFAERWFSRRGWTTGQRRNLGLSAPDKSQDAQESAQHRRKSSSLRTSPALRPVREMATADDAAAGTDADMLIPSEDTHAEKVTMALLPKLLQTTRLLLVSRTFYFSYEFDISRKISSQGKTPSVLPLHKQFDSQYFWNRHMTLPLVNGGYDELVLPLMQGFIGQRAFVMDTISEDEKSLTAKTPGGQVVQASQGDIDNLDRTVKEAKSSDKNTFLLTLISRRTTKRAGFRYLRRGIDEDGNVANAVETEQILSKTAFNEGAIHTFIQTRGSMPLFFQQTPYTFKPIPTLHESQEANKRAMKRHFEGLAALYGDLQAVSLIDQHGTEAKIGNAYEQYVKVLNKEGGLKNGKQILFNWFDFHNICRGMKFENVSILIGELAPFLSSSGWATMTSDARSVASQSGVVRTNCMDCLDRTNVVQSALALHTLQKQISVELEGDGQEYNSPALNDSKSAAFNALWADNGDAVSLTYAGTAALKGDYVRTRKRTALGLLSDLGLTLSRYYRNLFDDFFAQAALDYLLGNVSTSVFVEFQERMTTADPAVDIARARQSAVTTAANVIISDQEDLLAGWAVGAPAARSLETALAPEPPTASASVPRENVTPVTLRAQPFREILLLLSDRALYSAAYDWDAEKVRGFDRVELCKIKRLQWGTYITETNTAGQIDEERNVGLRIEFDYIKNQPRLRRMNTRTIGELADPGSLSPTTSHDQGRDGDELAAERPDEIDGESPQPADTQLRIMAFKALPRQTSFVRPSTPPSRSSRSERDFVKQMCDEIQTAADRHRHSSSAGIECSSASEGGLLGKVSAVVIEEGDIVSLDEARRSTTFAESVGYGLKKLVWG